MKTCSKCKEPRELVLFLADNRNTDGKQSQCEICRREDKKLYNATHREKNAIRHNKWYTVNAVKIYNNVKLWKKANPSKVLEARTRYKKKNAFKVNANTAKRRAQKLHATPVWANEFFIEEIYDLAQLRTKYLGVQYEVDHVIPLVHPLVCGLHVESNLQVIPMVENQRKNNRFEVC